MKNLYKYLILAVLVQFALNVYSQSMENTPEKKRVTALKISEPLKIDAKLDEECYKQVSPATDFVQLQPRNGDPAMQKSEVWFFFDHNAIYLGAFLHDESPDSIFNYLTQRDNIGMSDYFGVYIDPYNKGLVAFGFFLNAAGVQTDMKATKGEFDSEDENWNAVWESKTRVTDEGWIVEMKLPFSALRFSNNTGEVWGMNMFRNLRRYNSNNSWNFVNRKVSGFIHQQGELEGIKGIKSPVRLSLTPYAATYFEPQNEQTKTIFKGGLDMKYGISDAFTLDMMLIPDFGQIQSDDQELNLSPYEIHYNEKRQFFTEGTELFNRAEVFYSRRIGSQPKFSGDLTTGENEKISYSPSETQLVNATKISGRTRKGLGVGFLNAMSLESRAIIENQLDGTEREAVVQPFTNYNVTVVDQSLKYNSFVSLINTNLSMWNNPYTANVTATQFELRDKSMTYALKGMGGFSSKGTDQKENGYSASLSLEKNSGSIFWGLKERVFSDKYDPNDMGFLLYNNFISTEGWVFYQMIEPKGIFREWQIDVWTNYERLYKPSVFTDIKWGYDFFARFKNNSYLQMNGDNTGEKFDYHEPRKEGRYYKRPMKIGNKLRYGTDPRNRLQAELIVNYDFEPGSEMFQQKYSSDLNLRIGQRLTVSHSLSYQHRDSERGFTDILDDGNVLFARRNVATIENSLFTQFVINNTMGITCRARHYWSAVKNRDFFLLEDNGSLSGFNIQDNYDMNYNAFTVDMIYRWVFMPGSELSVSWKSNAFLLNEFPTYHYMTNLDDSWQNMQNSISAKVIFYIDYNSLRKKTSTLF